eukprot:7391618-Prymnesium_polylepis.3
MAWRGALLTVARRILVDEHGHGTRIIRGSSGRTPTRDDTLPASQVPARYASVGWLGRSSTGIPTASGAGSNTEAGWTSSGSTRA